MKKFKIDYPGNPPQLAGWPAKQPLLETLPSWLAGETGWPARQLGRVARVVYFELF